jgi:hypothetical protein
MLKVYVDADERYPDYSLSDVRRSRGELELEVGRQTLARWRRVIEAYNEVQAEIGELVSP